MGKTIRVLHLLKTTAGAAWAVKLLREQVALGIEVHVVLPDACGNAKAYEDNGCKLHYLNVDLAVGKPWLNVSKICALRTIVKNILPDIVHSHFVSTTLIMRMAMIGITTPRIFQVPGPLHLEHKFFRSIELLLSNRSDHWIGSCQWTVDKYLALGVHLNNVHLSYYGTDVDSFRSTSPSVLREQLCLSKDTIIISMVAYMYSPKYFLGQTRGLKGHEDLIDAVSIVRETHSNVHLVFVGGEWGGGTRYEDNVMAYGKQKLADNVTFLGNRKDVLNLYPSIDIAVFPSHSENVGGAVESLLMKVPTITSDVGGFPDLVINQKTGLTVPAKKPDLLASAIAYYMENMNKAKEHAIVGNELARELFDVKNTAKETFQIYETILTKK